MAKQLWIIEDETFPLSEISYETHGTAVFKRPFSCAFFCPLCGEIWARRVVTGGDPQWILFQRPCSRHPDSLTRGLSGSVWLSWEGDVVKNLPRAVLHREALLLIKLLYPEEFTQTQAVE